jgi:hypothetical protein
MIQPGLRPSAAESPWGRFPYGFSIRPASGRAWLPGRPLGIADAGQRLGSYETVLAAIGQESHYAAPRPPDILTITETRSNAKTGPNADTDFLTRLIDDAYGSAANYDHGLLNGGKTGSGTQGVIYNTRTVRLIQEFTVGTTSSTTAARQELRYQFRPVGYNEGVDDFYVYAGHYKAGTGPTDVPSDTAGGC